MRVRVTPKSARNAIQGLHYEPEGAAALKIALTAPPADGKANAALIALLAGLWRLPKSRFQITGGRSDRRKTVMIAGDAAFILPRLSEWWRDRSARGEPSNRPS